MQTSRKSLSTNLKSTITDLLFRTVADLKNADEVKMFLVGILSDVELEVIAKRLEIVRRLEKGESYDQIKTDLQTSSTTVAAMADLLKKNEGLRLAMEKIKAGEWAKKWASKINGLFN